jgi:putative N6-adenine-specific DNA methylase
MRRFGFEKLLPFQPHVWHALQDDARALEHAPTTEIHASDVAFRMVDFTQRNAERAGVGQVVQARGGDALQRMPPCETPGLMLLNPPYGERIEAAGVAGVSSRAREIAEGDDGGEFFSQLASHWKKNYNGWTAWMLTPDLKLPSKMRLKESRRVPMWNGPIECRMFRFDLMKGSVRDKL